ncbi:hypothetical protein FOG48_02722 [Hanseniaspora uvarum]|nr:hypothetical protein FOG48_02722 [Hanseniaspora uvarum]
MQYNKKTVLASTLVATSAMAAYVPSEPWTTLTPTATYSGATTDYATSFGIAVEPISTGSYASYYASSSSAATQAKRDAISQISDGQIQATTKTTSTQHTTTAAAVSQITDGQIQATTKTETTKHTTTAAAVSQITDGQVQATTKTQTTAEAVSQITDGQVQATTKTTSTEAAVSQITDGQVQATTKTTSSTEAAASQITDGQIQATTSTTSSASESATSASASSSAASSSATASSGIDAVSCKNSGTLSMKLDNGVLSDEKGRIGSIVANRQFQFDGPPPQAGAIYANGWGITPEGNLAIGNEDVFWQCLSGDFYNLYDTEIGGQCKPVHLEVVNLVSC